MPKSVASYYSLAVSRDSEVDEEEHGQNDGSQEERTTPRTPLTPSTGRRQGSSRTSDLDLRSRLPARLSVDENTSLLLDSRSINYRSLPATAPSSPVRHRFSRQHSYANSIRRNHSRHGSLGVKVARAFGTDPNATEDDDLQRSRVSMAIDDRVWYDQFTSTDWVHDSIADAYRVKELRSRRDWRGRVAALYDAAQGWILVALVGCITAGVAYCIDVTESTAFDIKTGYCSTKWYHSKRQCCGGVGICDDWTRWSTVLTASHERTRLVDFAVFNFWVVGLALLACLLTLQTKTSISSAISLSTLDENLGADRHQAKDNEGRPLSASPSRRFSEAAQRPPVVYYPAAGSGVAEVKVILSGFVLHGYLGVQTLVLKSIGLVLSVASGLSIGKEGPYVHIAACIGNISCRLFDKYSHNDGKRREVLSAAAASGVAVAFGAPIGGVLFSLEEVSYYFPPKTLFRTFFCCIAAALSLRFLDPYGTHKIVLFEVRYLQDWRFIEMFPFALLGVLGGLLGAFFIKASRLWARTFRQIPTIKQYPLFEVFLVAIITGLVSFWNRYTRLPVAELLFELSSPCDAFSDSGDGLCPTKENIPHVIWYLCVAFLIKAALTTITFGIKVPAGIYVPSMVVGGLLGRIVGHGVQYLVISFPDFFGHDTNGNPESIIVPGVYALVCAGATMCGVTRLSVTLSVILFELTGSLEHVLPFSIGVLISKWTADALEPLSIYDLLTDMNAYPYLDAKARPVFTTDLGDITPAPKRSRIIDISKSPLVPANQLRKKLDYMHMAGELDGGLPILRDGILVGLIPGPDLEFALDGLVGEDGALCLMSMQSRWQGPGTGIDGSTEPVESSHRDETSEDEDDEVDGGHRQRRLHLNTPAASQSLPRAQGRDAMSGATPDPTDFTSYIDPAPVVLDICSPMDLVFECFVKLGLRYICVIREGKFAGLIHKKAFVRYVKEVEEGDRRGRE